MRINCRNYVRSVLQHYAVQGLCTTWPLKRSLDPLQGTCLPNFVCCLGRGWSVNITCFGAKYCHNAKLKNPIFTNHILFYCDIKQIKASSPLRTCKTCAKSIRIWRATQHHVWISLMLELVHWDKVLPSPLVWPMLQNTSTRLVSGKLNDNSWLFYILVSNFTF